MRFMPKPQTPAIDRIMSKVRIEKSGCWIFTGRLHKQGYGEIDVPGPTGKYMPKLAHVVMWEAKRGTIAPGLELDHLCRMESCCNPDHLEPVTHRENVRRGMAGAHLKARTHCPRGHEYTPDNTQLKRNGNSISRTCRQCHRDYSRRKYRERKRGRS